LTTLDIILDAVNLIEKHRGVKIDTQNLPLDDAKTYEIFSNGFTSGVFQFESSGMVDVLRRYQPNRIEDLCALNALYRPGPIQGGMIPDFIDRKHGRKQVIYDLPELKPILEETYGVILYQEQVMLIAVKLAGYSLGEADLLRRAMGKKNAAEMAKQRERFVSGAKARGLSEKKVIKIFDLMEQFAGYGFNKSHSAAYAYLAYVTAYLKAHYPIEFMCALLTSETGNTAKVVKYINECRDMGIQVLPPDINSSDKDFTPAAGAIRFGLCAVKNVGAGAVESVIQSRADKGPFHSIYEFCERVDLGAVNRRMIESLIKAGAMDTLEGNRAQLFGVVEGAMEAGQRAWKDRDSGQTGLFGGAFDDETRPEPLLPSLPGWTSREKLTGEKEMLGIYVTGHPLDEFEDKARDLATHDSGNVESLERGAEVALCGILTAILRRRNREGKLWASMQLEDRKGALEAMVFTTNYENLLTQLVEDQAVLVRGMILPEENAPPKISIQSIVALENARVDLPSLISVRIPVSANGGINRAEELRKLFERKQGPTGVRLRIEKSRDFSVILDVTGTVRPDKEFRAEVERICGPESFEVLAN
ncbi:MAG: DNA polymerase III subunit alpha, partial [Bryobacteraceae bacterium]